jgi:hypothetical protein
MACYSCFSLTSAALILFSSHISHHAFLGRAPDRATIPFSCLQFGVNECDASVHLPTHLTPSRCSVTSQHTLLYQRL